MKKKNSKHFSHLQPLWFDIKTLYAWSDSYMYSHEDALNTAKEIISGIIHTYELPVQIEYVCLSGSRSRGTHNTDSDLDVLVFYRGTMAEDSFFNILNENKEVIELQPGYNVPFDFNPIHLYNESGNEELYHYLMTADCYMADKLAADFYKLLKTHFRDIYIQFFNKQESIADIRMKMQNKSYLDTCYSLLLELVEKSNDEILHESLRICKGFNKFLPGYFKECSTLLNKEQKEILLSLRVQITTQKEPETTLRDELFAFYKTNNV